MADPTVAAKPFDAIRQTFFEDGDGFRDVAARSALTDEFVCGEFSRIFVDAERLGVALIAVGGYGRAQLFPYSDVDLLLLIERPGRTANYKEQISQLLTRLWDANLRVSHSVRSPAECARLAADNAELNISLLDTRFLAGDQSLYEDLRYRQLPRFYLREQKSLLKNLVELAHQRHLLAGETIYHLEPDVKETPGGLRDFQLACWVAQLSHVSALHLPESEECLPPDVRDSLLEAKRFLFAVRCYLHYFNARDNNKLTFDLQEEINGEGAGKAFRERQNTSEWMRDYFRNVRVIYRLATRMIEETATTGQSLFTFFRDRKSRLSNNDFVVRRGRLYLRNSQALNHMPELVLQLCAFVARHGVPLALGTEKRIAQALPAIQDYVRPGKPLWPAVAEILSLPFAYEALTAMHETGVLTALFPQFELIDCLVIRDFYHRYTVDEHTFVTIQTLHDLAAAEDKLTQRYSRLLSELERPQTLYFSLLFHDVGKGAPDGGHAERSIELAEAAMNRIHMNGEDREMVRFLIRRHLDMSTIMTRRDLSEPETIEQFSNLVGTLDRLKALTLMTFADISAVNPRAMTDWRKELLWQLYIATYRNLIRDVSEHRIHIDPSEELLKQSASEQERQELSAFLEGFPQRYLRTHSLEQIREQFQMSRELQSENSVVNITRRHSLYEGVIITRDRPFLFASLCATFASYGLNIEKAEAFSNQKGLALDTFVVSDPQRAFELNPQELKDFQKTLLETAEGTADLDSIINRRQKAFAKKRRSRIEPVVSYENDSSPTSTVFHITAEDRTGLLFDLASKFSQHECNIDVVLIDTQGRRAIDVFYVAGANGEKLDSGMCETLQQELTAACTQKQL